MRKYKLKNRIVQVTFHAELLKRIDAEAGLSAKSRASFILRACEQRLKHLQEDELDRQYREGHRRNPEDLGWAKSSANLFAKQLLEEDW